MPAYQHIERYHTELERLIAFGGSDNEKSIRPAFESGEDARIGAVSGEWVSHVLYGP